MLIYVSVIAAVGGILLIVFIIIAFICNSSFVNSLLFLLSLVAYGVAATIIFFALMGDITWHKAGGILGIMLAVYFIMMAMFKICDKR